MSTTDVKNVLIHGIGNELLTDDGIGPKLVKQLQNENTRTDIEFETAFLGGLEVLEAIQGFKTVIVVDAIKTKGGIPGDVYFFTLDDFEETLHASHMHDVSFLQAIELGHKLGYDMPEQIHVIAIEIVEDLIFSTEYTPEVQKRYPEIVQKVKNRINELTGLTI